MIMKNLRQHAYWKGFWSLLGDFVALLGGPGAQERKRAQGYHRLGASLGRHGALWGRLGAPFGCCLGCLEAILEAAWAAMGF